MKRFQTIAVNFPGGIVSPGNLLEVLEIAGACKVEQVSFGLRQQLLLEVPLTTLQAFAKACNMQKIIAEPVKEAAPNMVSSYVCTGIFCEDTWVTEGVYKDVFTLLQASRRLLKVNICDPQQTFVPLFTGHINWIATPQKHYWYLYLRFPDTDKLYIWPEEIYTNHLADMTVLLEEALRKKEYAPLVAAADGAGLFTSLKPLTNGISRPVQQELRLKPFHLPYYEGFNKYGTYYWLGIYRRDELFPLRFLSAVCKVCLDNKIGELHATPWKSIVIKNIAPDGRAVWDRVLGQHRINVRHAANELNWWVEDGSEDALVVKRQVIRYFDREDVRTYGLCFSVLLKKPVPAFGSVMICQKAGQGGVHLKSQFRYDIYYAEDFHPNTGKYVLFREGVEKEHLGPYLVSVSKLFYEYSAAPLTETPPVQAGAAEPAGQGGQVVYACNACGTVYDPSCGDVLQGIAAHTPFHQLPSQYTCWLCGTKADNYKELVV